MTQDASLRALTQPERKLLDRLLRLQFPGVQALRVQARSVQAVADHRPRPRAYQVVLLRFEVTDAEAPRARVRHSQPVAARVRGHTPKREVLLTVRDGVLSDLEVVDLSGELPDELPLLEELHPPSVNYVMELG
jgi:hypothetical protein